MIQVRHAALFIAAVLLFRYQKNDRDDSLDNNITVVCDNLGDDGDEKWRSMEYRYLKGTGLQVSVLGYGAWETFALRLDFDDAYDIMRTSFRLGINFFDNAELYANGAAERVMGRIIKRGEKECVWKRSQLVITTKLFWGAPRWLSRPNEMGLSRKHVLEGMAASLRRLQLRYVDIVYAHRPDSNVPMEEVVRAFSYIVESGQSMYWGTSEWSKEEIREATKVARELRLVAPTVEQPQYSMLVRTRVEHEYADLFEEMDIGMTVYSTLAYGVLSGKYGIDPSDGSVEAPANSRLSKFVRPDLRNRIEGSSGKTFEQILSILNNLRPLATRLNATLPQLAIAWVLRNPNVTSAILGGTTAKQIEENVLAVDVAKRLSDADMQFIEAALS
eukprot:g2154.t1